MKKMGTKTIIIVAVIILIGLFFWVVVSQKSAGEDEEDGLGQVSVIGVFGPLVNVVVDLVEEYLITNLKVPKNQDVDCENDEECENNLEAKGPYCGDDDKCYSCLMGTDPQRPNMGCRPEKICIYDEEVGNFCGDCLIHDDCIGYDDNKKCFNNKCVQCLKDDDCDDEFNEEGLFFRGKFCSSNKECFECVVTKIEKGKVIDFKGFCKPDETCGLEGIGGGRMVMVEGQGGKCLKVPLAPNLGFA